MNVLTGQQVSIVAPQPGTTTDPVRKAMELASVGPVVWVDTAGIDDTGFLGGRRVAESLSQLAQVDVALLLFSENTFGSAEEFVAQHCREHNIPLVLIYSLSDCYPPDDALLQSVSSQLLQTVIPFSVYDHSARSVILQAVAEALPPTVYDTPPLIGHRVGEGELVLLVVPIDAAAPTSRLILPQVQVMRDLLDHHARVLVCRETELAQTLRELPHPPSLVITDSQVFGEVSALVPTDVPLTSFSMILAHAKGPFNLYMQGVAAIDSLRDGDRVLMLESCTHAASCEDIGRVKLPRLLTRHTGKKLHCEAVSGLSALPRPITDYSLVIQCGGCVLTSRQLRSRLLPALQASVPVTNYGIAIAHLNGILPRVSSIFLSDNSFQ